MCLQIRPHNMNIVLNELSFKYVNLITNDEHREKMTDPRIKMDVVRHTKPSSRIRSRRDVQQLQPISHNLQSHQHVWHDRNPQVPHQYHHHNLGAHQQFYSHEGLTRFNEYGRPSFVQSHPPSEVFHSSQNAQTFVQQEYNASSSIQERNIHNINNNHHHHHQHNSFIYGGVNVSHNYQQQSTHDPRNCNQQQSTHDQRDYIQQLPPPHGSLGFHNDHDSIQVLDRELRQLALIPGHATTSSETQEEVLFQKHSREHVKVMIELGNKKRIKHPGDDAVHEHKSSKTRKLSLEVISEHHPVHTKPTELQIKTLPISETLRRDATLGGYIFLCKDETMDLEIMNQLFGKYDLDVIVQVIKLCYSSLCSLFTFDFFLESMEIC